MAPVSGYVLQNEAEPTLYIAGDTIWCHEVSDAIKHFHPDVIVLNAGGARFLEGDPITMMPDDVIHVCHAAPKAKIIAVHMEAVNHCLVTRSELAAATKRAGAEVMNPEDGEALDF